MQAVPRKQTAASRCKAHGLEGLQGAERGHSCLLMHLLPQPLPQQHCLRPPCMSAGVLARSITMQLPCAADR